MTEDQIDSEIKSLQCLIANIEKRFRTFDDPILGIHGSIVFGELSEKCYAHDEEAIKQIKESRKQEITELNKLLKEDGIKRKQRIKELQTELNKLLKERKNECQTSTHSQERSINYIQDIQP